MTDPAPEPGGGPDDPDLNDPLTADDIMRRAGAGDALDELPANESQASRLVALANHRYRLVRGDDSRPYAVEHNGPAIAFNLRGRDGLRTRLARTYYETFSQTPGGSALSDALTVLEGQAERTEPVPVGLRVAPAGPQAVALDLGTVDGRTVLVEPGAWRVVDRSPVLFRRSALMSPLPVPQRGGRLDALRELLNVDESRFRLVVAWLVAALLPELPHPILAMTGEQGTAKTTAARLVVSLVDPSPAPVRTAPTDVKTWATTAAASWVVALDNVSSIAPWFSDTLCKAVTGDGIVARALYTDDDLSVLTFRRCIALTSIDAGRLAGDLAERLLPIELARIAPERRRPDAEIAARYEAARPAILGALLDLLAQVLVVLPGVELAELPRMADFARVLAALDEVCGWSTLADYTSAAADAAHTVVEADPLAEAVRQLVERWPWQGTATELLAVITPERPPRGWPRSANALAGMLTRLAPALRAEGYGVEFARSPGHDRRRIVTLSGPGQAADSSPRRPSGSSDTRPLDF